MCDLCVNASFKGWKAPKCTCECKINHNANISSFRKKEKHQNVSKPTYVSYYFITRYALSLVGCVIHQ